MYTWMDATLRELTDLVKEVQTAARNPRARLQFALIYPDRQGKNVLRQVCCGVCDARLHVGHRWAACMRPGMAQMISRRSRRLGFRWVHCGEHVATRTFPTQTGDFLDVAILV